MENVLIVLILATILGGVIWYLIRAKKQGQACIGCPYSKQCQGKCGCRRGEDTDPSNTGV